MKKLFTLFLVSNAFLLSAQGYKVNVQGQTQQAMGNTGTALIQDGASVFFNPGGVSFIKGKSISLGGNAAILKSTVVDSVDFSVTKTKNPIAAPFTLYAVYGFDSTANDQLQRVKFGLGVYTPFGGTVVYPDNWSGQKIVQTFNVKTLFIQPTVSYKLGSKLGIGAGFVYAIGALNKTQSIPKLDSTLNSSLTLEGKMQGIGFNAGLYYNPTKELSIGLTYRSKVEMDVKNGNATFNNIPTSLKDSLISDGFSTTLLIPQIITIGAAYKLNEKLTLASDICFNGFKIVDSSRIEFDKPTYSNPNQSIPRHFKNAYSFHLGGQYKIIDQLSARIGLQYIMSVVPKGFVTPDIPDANRLVYSGGIGYKINASLDVNASYTFQSIYIKQDNSLYYKFPATYKTYASIIGLSISYNF